MIIVYKVNYGYEEFTSGYDKSEIVSKLYTWRLEGEERQLYAKLKDYREDKRMSFDEELTTEYVNKYIIDYLFNDLKKYGYTIFKQA